MRFLQQWRPPCMALGSICATSQFFSPALAFSYVILSNQTTKSHSKLFILAIILAINALFASLFDALFRMLYRSISDFAQLAISPFLIAFAACTAVGLFWVPLYIAAHAVAGLSVAEDQHRCHVALRAIAYWNNTFKNVSETHFLAILPSGACVSP